MEGYFADNPEEKGRVSFHFTSVVVESQWKWNDFEHNIMLKKSSQQIVFNNNK